MTDFTKTTRLAGALTFVLASGAEAQSLLQLRAEFETLYAHNPASEVCFSNGQSIDFRMLHTSWFPGTNNLVTVELTPRGIDVFVMDTAWLSTDVTVTEAQCAGGSTYRVGVTGTQPYKCHARLSDAEEPAMAEQVAWCIAAFNLMPFLLETGEFMFEFDDPASAEQAADLLRQIIAMS